ncbi:MAG: hypothetical protein K2X87_31555 [Gemmataceae bacterium]|nr:hypothetical protein [Gemmataceae bacterium]
MMRRLLRSKWWWLAACVAAGAAVVAVSDWLVLREGLALVDALAAGFGAKPDTPRRYSVSILFGLIRINDTSHPYLWFTLGSLLTGGGLGLAVWGSGRMGLWAGRRVRCRGVGGPAEPGAAPDRRGM